MTLFESSQSDKNACFDTPTFFRHSCSVYQVENTCSTFNTAWRSVICVRGLHDFVTWESRMRRGANSPVHLVKRVVSLRQATPWRLERRSLLFRDAVWVPLKPLRKKPSVAVTSRANEQTARLPGNHHPIARMQTAV